MYNEDEEMLGKFIREQRRVLDRLYALQEQGVITSYESDKLIGAIREVFGAITKKYDRIRKAGEEMYGPILVTDIDIAHEEGMREGKQEVAVQMKSEGLDIDTIAKCTGLSKEEIESL